ncbi:MAG: methyltransferase, partial [Bryobacteraceae bacterium]
MSPRFGTPQQYSTLRQFLNASGFREEAVQARLGIAKLSQSLGMRSNAPADDALELLIQLFLLGESVPELPAEIHEVLLTLDLVQRDTAGWWSATVSLYPSGNVWVISDKNSTSEHDDNEAEAPRVFSAITPQTEDFLDMLPHTACPAFLEMCAGAGAAALHAGATYATHASAFDISDRCAHMAEWSRRLNGLENVTVRQGDLYQPAGRQTFDRIAAHPPYVPSLRSEQLFRDGGEDGEFLTRRLIEGLPNYLHPGGAFYCLCLTAGVAGDPLPQRIRRWLREREREFHLVIIVRRTVEPARLILDNWSHR